MCAISGIIGLEVSPGVAEQMLKTMARRGPDQERWVQLEGAVFLHSRLAVIDLEGGKQPMELTWGGKKYCIVYNGELYNTDQLRRELEREGHRFEGHSDTEVVLHAYAQYGADCVLKFNGIFAFGVWESGSRELFLARDRIGVKPLFYSLYQGGLLFASEMKTILSYPGFPARISSTGAAQLIMLGPGRLPGSGVFEDIMELEPGCMASYRDGKLSVTRYWKLIDREHRDSFQQTVEQVRFLVEDAVCRQMISDVPIGCFLSGGLDSSIITAICAREMRKQGQKLKTFSVDYQNNDRYFQANKFQPDADSAYIREMVRAEHTEHSDTVLTAEDLVNALEQATFARDLPGMADVDFSLLAFCGEIRKSVKVALSGECADEIFGGYPWYRDPEVRARVGFPWAQNTWQRAQLLPERLGNQGEELVMDAYQQTCQESDILPGTTPMERRMKEMVNLNFRWFMQTLLDRKDRMSMYHGLEVRVPFCDYRIAEYLYGVPWEYKDYQGREKGLLRCAVEGLLPESVLYRKKSPYPKTFDPRYGQLIQERMQTLLSQDAPIWHLVRKEAVEDMICKDSPWPWYGQLMRRPQTMAYFLQLDVWLRKYKVELCF